VSLFPMRFSFYCWVLCPTLFAFSAHPLPTPPQTAFRFRSEKVVTTKQLQRFYPLFPFIAAAAGCWCILMMLLIAAHDSHQDVDGDLLLFHWPSGCHRCCCFRALRESNCPEVFIDTPS